MAKALKCDRCGGFYDLVKNFRKYQILDTEIYEKRVDLCPDCYDKFLNFLKEGNWSGMENIIDDEKE